MEEKFKYWLENVQKLAKNTRTNYTNRLKSKIPEKMKEIGFFDKKKSLYECELEELVKIQEMFNSNEHGLLEWNRSKTIGSEALSSLNYFIDFLKISNKQNNNSPLNQILYGPPGTGKTYNTINKALEIIDGEVPRTRKDAKEKFDKYREDGQIEFVTFHQSYGYEEFIEGIKADINSAEIRYILEDGIFKKLCEKAQLEDEENFDEVYKNFIAYIQENEDEKLILKTKMGKSFELSVNSKDNLNLHTGKDKKKQGVLTKENILLAIQGLDSIGGWKSYFLSVVEYLEKEYSYKFESQNKNQDKNYILIIDEINRGNISKIFGELITLIEPSKRIGEDEALKLTLPNSKDSFGVPSNLYIIGTMNTADRSIAQIDTALRRRFEFIEMMPKPELIVDEDDNPLVIDEIEVQKVLESMNERIEYMAIFALKVEDQNLHSYN